MADRRSILRGLVLLLISLAGCSSFGDENQEKEHTDVDVMNITGEPQVVTVEARADDESLFEHEYDMFADQGDQSQSFTGTPDTVSVDVEDGTSETFEFIPPRYCDEEKSNEPRVILTIYEADDVGLSYGCAE